MDFTSLTGQLCQTESSVSGFQSKVRSRSPGKICHREPSSSSTRWLSEWDRILVARSFRVAGLGMRRPIGYFCPDGACASSCWGRACWLRDGRPHIPPQRRACRGQPCGRQRRRRWRPWCTPLTPPARRRWVPASKPRRKSLSCSFSEITLAQRVKSLEEGQFPRTDSDW